MGEKSLRKKGGKTISFRRALRREESRVEKMKNCGRERGEETGAQPRRKMAKEKETLSNKPKRKKRSRSEPAKKSRKF